MQTASDTTGHIRSALIAAAIPEKALPFALAQAAHETSVGGNPWTSKLFTDSNNASGLTWGGSAAQKATGALPSRPQPKADGRAIYTKYPDVFAWARDFARFLNFDRAKKGRPADADTVEEYVHRLKANGYFGASEAAYLAGVRKYVNKFAGNFDLDNGAFEYAAASNGDVVAGSGDPDAISGALSLAEKIAIGTLTGLLLTGLFFLILAAFSRGKSNQTVYEV